MISSDFARQKTFFQHLLSGDLNQISLMAASGNFNSKDEELMSCFVLKKEHSDIESQLGILFRGWHYYYSAQYEQALKYFQDSLTFSDGWDSWAWLGIGKVASDWLDWSKASGFLIHALQIARNENDLVRMTECYGALGEVAFRSGHYQLAYELFSMDKALLIPGSYQDFRVANYLSICVGRLGHVDLAFINLKENYYAALNHDPVSSDYSLSSMVICAMINGQEEQIEGLTYLLNNHSFTASMPQGFIALGQAWYQRARNMDKCVEYLEKSIIHFNPFYPLEKAYIKRLKSSLEKRNPGDEIERLSHRAINLPELPLGETIVLDAFIQERLNCKTSDFYQSVLDAQDDLWSLCRYFFV